MEKEVWVNIRQGDKMSDNTTKLNKIIELLEEIIRGIRQINAQVDEIKRK